MVFATPIWLLALIPWAALAVWMLWGRRERVGVPFLALWRDSELRPSASRAIQAPPVPIILLLLTILLAILAGSSPVLLPAGSGRSLIVLVDRGITMSARDGDAYRYVRAAERVAPHVRGAVRVIAVPPRPVQATDAAGLLDAVRSLPPTAVDTSADVAQAAIRLLATSDNSVLVLTDRAITVADPRLIAIAPPAADANVGITYVAARERPSAQVMVRIHADNPSTIAIVVASYDQRVQHKMEAPGTAFIDVPRLGKTVEVALAQGDELEADDRAWLVRERGWPRIEPIASLPAELARMIEAYRKVRSPTDDGRVVAIVDAPDDPAGEAAGEAVILAPPTGPAMGSLDVVDHPVTTDVAWAQVLSEARLGQAAPEGFEPVVSAGKGIAVATRENPRQVWVALESPAFARRADYVIFWANVFDWLGQGEAEFAAHPIGLLGDGWRRVTDGPAGTEPGLWPGIYERGDGTLRAVNAGAHAPPAVPPIESDWRPELARLVRSGTGGRTLSPYLLLAALACALGAALCWPARRAAQA
ncbi:MAG TPA: hypothetical protein VGR35_18915 [Tepidisphaeraceae bacterium]|nr:hypothetical protein [Tepidisphaeraceae bacterium]